MEWIKVEDRLPEKGKLIMYLKIYSDNPEMGYFSKDRWFAHFNHDGEIKGNACYESEIDTSESYVRITHWMELPQLPAERPKQ